MPENIPENILEKKYTADYYFETIRPIEKEDYHRGYRELFATLTECGALTEQEFAEILEERNREGWFTWVIEDRQLLNFVIGTISVSYERKIYRGGRYVAHIEDVIVLPEYQHFKLGTLLNEFAIAEAQKKGCYKVILDCKKELEEFYNKAGLVMSNIQMAKYF